MVIVSSWTGRLREGEVLWATPTSYGVVMCTVVTGEVMVKLFNKNGDLIQKKLVKQFIADAG